MKAPKITYRIVGELSEEAREGIIEKLILAGMENFVLSNFTQNTKDAA